MALLDHLETLVAFDTRNPPRALDEDDAIFAYVAAALTASGFGVEVVDEGAGCVSVRAVRGRPTRLINVHLDTVPSNPDWSRDPFTLRIEGDRAVGLGACDIKGGAAAVLEAAALTEGPAAVLFSTDEEYGESLCIHRFLRAPPNWLDGVELVVVSEPTSCRAVCAHRGFARGVAEFTGIAGHSSKPRALTENANHKLAAWLTEAVAHAKTREDEGAFELTGLRFNCGIVKGGLADNVIAARADAVFSIRPGPGIDPGVACEDLGGRAEFVGPTLPARDVDNAAERAAERAREFDLALAPAVDFWTEAALFSDAGFTTFVCGPGNIAQAHTADEWVTLDDLARAQRFFTALMEPA